MNHSKIMDFREVLGEIAVNSGADPYLYIVAGFEPIGDEWRLDGVQVLDSACRGILADAAKRQLMLAALVAQYRPDMPEPNVLDVINLGVMCGTNKVRLCYDRSKQYWVDIVDSIIVDGNGKWKSVHAMLDLEEHTWCEHCQTRFYHEPSIPPRPAADDKAFWELLADNHGKGCPWIATRGQIVEPAA